VVANDAMASLGINGLNGTVACGLRHKKTILVMMELYIDQTFCPHDGSSEKRSFES
jgi:hypothetical protein